MKTALALVTFVSVILAACLPLTDQADGASCSKDDECKSSRCRDGYCMGSECRPGDSSSCEDGWKCTHSDPDPITGFFGANGSDTCKPTCGHCPGNFHCDKDAPAGTICSYGKPPLELSITSENAVVGRDTKLTATSANGSGRLGECKWDLGDGKPEEKTGGPTLVRTFAEARKYTARVSCKDDFGGFGYIESSIEITCVPSGDTCAPRACCIDANMRCVNGTCRVPSPPTVEVTGPLTVPVSTEGTYSVTLVGGDGKAERASWKFGESFFSEDGLTTTHDFFKAGPNEASVTVTTDIGTQVSKAFTVNVCQSEGGRCGMGGVECCAPLTCQGTTIPTCQK